MTPQTHVRNERLPKSSKGSTCIFSVRGIDKMVARCVDYEFEDVICEIDDVNLVYPTPTSWLPVGKRVAYRLWRYVSPKFSAMNPGLTNQELDKDYDLFFAVCMNAWDLIYLNAVKGWQQRCKTKVCWIDEIWIRDLSDLKGLLVVLSQFDHVFIGCSQTTGPLQALIHRPVHFIPAGIDALRFCPYPNPPARTIDVLNIGRRSQVTHQALMHMSGNNQIFYIHDTVPSNSMFPRDHQQHRQLLASMAKRSRYFIVNTAKVDRDIETDGQAEIGFRFYEGAACGAIMIGQIPDVPTFQHYFGWPDAVIPMDFDMPDIGAFLQDLDSNPERLAEARRQNVIQSLRHHDWVYRWKTILKTVGLAPTPALADRERRLKALAEAVEGVSSASASQPVAGANDHFASQSFSQNERNVNECPHSKH